jgi:hypothetical protein
MTMRTTLVFALESEAIHYDTYLTVQTGLVINEFVCLTPSEQLLVDTYWHLQLITFYYVMIHSVCASWKMTDVPKARRNLIIYKILVEWDTNFNNRASTMTSSTSLTFQELPHEYRWCRLHKYWILCVKMLWTSTLQIYNWCTNISDYKLRFPDSEKNIDASYI